MIPQLWGFPAWNVLWAVAAIVGALTSVVALRARGLPAGRALVAVLGAGAAAWAGAKTEWLIENRIPFDAFLHSAGARAPGGLIALVLVYPPLLRLLGLPVLRSLDAIVPAVALSIAVGRIGCFLQGCCFGLPTHLPWGIRFPPGSPAYESHIVLGLLTAGATASLPVHPLELYFAVDALLIAALLVWLTPRAQYAGQIALGFLVLRCWSKTILEHFRGRDFTGTPNRSGDVEVWVAVAATLAIALIALLRQRHQAAGAVHGASSA